MTLNDDLQEINSIILYELFYKERVEDTNLFYRHKTDTQL